MRVETSFGSCLFVARAVVERRTISGGGRCGMREMKAWYRTVTTYQPSVTVEVDDQRFTRTGDGRIIDQETGLLFEVPEDLHLIGSYRTHFQDAVEARVYALASVDYATETPRSKAEAALRLHAYQALRALDGGVQVALPELVLLPPLVAAIKEERRAAERSRDAGRRGASKRYRDSGKGCEEDWREWQAWIDQEYAARPRTWTALSEDAAEYFAVDVSTIRRQAKNPRRLRPG